MYARIKCCCSTKTSLLSAKCRIAPAIPQTLPRLELLSCLLLARLVADVLNAIKGEVHLTGLYYHILCAVW